MNEDAEFYFIQYWFATNRDVLRRASRDLYDALFERYLPIYQDGRRLHVDLASINQRFNRSLGGSQ